MSTSTSDVARAIVARARRTAAAAARRAAERAPVRVGPRAVRVHLERARLGAAEHLRKGGDATALSRAVAPLLGSDDPLVRARALDLVGDRDGALAAVRAARSRRAVGGVDPVESALLELRLLAGIPGTDARTAVLHDLVAATPGSTRQASDVVDALAREGGPGQVALAQQYRPLLVAAGASRALAALDDLIDTSRLVTAHGRPGTAFDEAVAALAAPRRGRMAARALAQVGDWDRLAAVLDGAYAGAADGREAATGAGVAEAAGVTGVPVAELARWSSRALRAGHTGAAVRLAQRVLEVAPQHPKAREVLQNGRDQMAVLAQGWQRPPVGEAPYAPEEHAVLAVLSQSLPIRSGGYATRTHGVLTGLAARGWHIEAVTRLGFPYDRWPAADERTVPDHDVVDGITYHRLLQQGVRRYPQYPLSEYVTTMADGVERLARQHRARLVHASSFYVTGLAAAAAARRLGLPFIYEMRGLEDLMKGVRDPQFHTTDRYRFLEYVETEVCHEADAVFVITEALRREMVRRGVPEDKLIVLPNGVHTEQFAPRERDRELERALGVEGIPVIGYAGSMVDYEGLELLLEAVAVLTAQGVAFRLVVVGDGPADASVRAAAQRLDLGDVVTFTGRVSHDEVSRYLSLFDVTPFPRLPLPVCELISPMKPFEALAMGKAVVVSSVAALTEIIRDNETGLVFDKGDATDLAAKLRLLLESPELRARLGGAGLEWVRKERDWAQVTATADRTYRAVLERHAAAGRTATHGH